MRQDCLSVLSMVAVLSYLCFIKGTQGSRRSHCGPYYCTHGSCQYTNINGVETHSCTCNPGWHGDHCDQSAPGSGHRDHCHNHCGEHGTCTMHQSRQGHEYWNCKCDRGWHGDNCTIQYIVTHTTHCHNTYCVNGVCTYYQDTMGHKWGYHCRCHHDWEGDHCDQEKTSSRLSPPTTTTSTTSPTTTKTTTAPTTKQTTLPPASATSPAVATLSVAHISTTNTPHTQTTAITVATCNHVDTLSAIAQQTSVSNQNAIECSPGVHTSHEALVLTDCSVSQSPALWKQGVNVMTACSLNAIPNYTPIAAFDHGQYSSIGSLSGIFLGCTSDGFKMVVQTCGQTPYIAELHLGGSNTQNPNMYFTIS